MVKRKIEVLGSLKRGLVETRNMVELGLMEDCVLDTFVWDSSTVSQLIQKVDESIVIIKTEKTL